MKYLLFLCVVVAAVWADEKYSDKYDDINVQEVLENDRLFLPYFNCVMGRGKCTPDAKQLQVTLPDALATGCSKCTKKQEEGATIVIDHLIKNEPEKWKELCAKFDPDGTWRKTYEERAKAKGIIIPQK